jgi:A/G-specific adenine glycosylase
MPTLVIVSNTVKPGAMTTGTITGMDDHRLQVFQDNVWDFYRDHGRHDLPWRVDPSPYHVFISEIMLQQTQVSRVLIKYAEWLAAFPDFEAVARASVAEVLQVWQGLGYNRRGLWVREAARTIAEQYGGQVPRELAELVKLKGVGVNTAGSMAAFAYNEPVVFIETNIRRVFIHEFFGEQVSGPVSDGQLMPLVEAALDREHPREWYWALMDYGADLAKRVSNPNRRSKHYNRQSQFEGSLRQIRGEVLRQLLTGPKSADELGITDDRLPIVLAGLVKDGLISFADNAYQLAD